MIASWILLIEKSSFCFKKKQLCQEAFVCYPHTCLRHPNCPPLAEGVFRMNLTVCQRILMTADLLVSNTFTIRFMETEAASTTTTVVSMTLSCETYPQNRNKSTSTVLVPTQWFVLRKFRYKYSTVTVRTVLHAERWIWKAGKSNLQLSCILRVLLYSYGRLR